MNLDDVINKSKYRSQSKRGALQSNFRFLYHPFLMPNNYWVWRFVPGIFVGVVLGLLFKQRNKTKGVGDGEEVEQTIESVNPDEDVKLVMVVNKGLKTMKPGKMAAQCGHAAGMVVKKLLTGRNVALLHTWEACGQPKVVVKAQSKEEMEALGDAARSLGIMVTTVLDAGRTQVEPGSMTVVAIGPASVAKINSVTGHLPLM